MSLKEKKMCLAINKMINKMTIHNISDDVLFLNNPNQTQTQQQRQSQTSTPDVALQSQMISHRMQATSVTSGLHTPGGTAASTPSNQSHLRSSYHPHQPPRSQVSSVRLSNISSGGSSDLDSREYFIFKLKYYQSRERKFSCAKKTTWSAIAKLHKIGSLLTKSVLCHWISFEILL